MFQTFTFVLNIEFQIFMSFAVFGQRSFILMLVTCMECPSHQWQDYLTKFLVVLNCRMIL